MKNKNRNNFSNNSYQFKINNYPNDFENSNNSINSINNRDFNNFNKSYDFTNNRYNNLVDKSMDISIPATAQTTAMTAEQITTLL